MKKQSSIFFLLLAFVVFFSCQEGDTTQKHNANEEENCVNPTKDPNDVKPMARMMRTMADYCDSMRLELLAGKTVDSSRYPLMNFWTAEPTDSSVLEPLFFSHAKGIESAYRTLMSSTENQKENYTAVINQCMACHSNYCSGPLRRIRKLSLDYKGEE